MNTSNAWVEQLHSIRHLFDKESTAQKIRWLDSLIHQPVASKKSVQLFFDTLQFIIAYPDNKSVYAKAVEALEQLRLHIESHERLKTSLYNTGVSGTDVCTSYSFELVKWLRNTRRNEIKLSFFEKEDHEIQASLSVVMPKVESEIFQDANADWRTWLKQSKQKNKDLLDQIISVYDGTTVRPEVKEELWNAMGMNVEIHLSDNCRLPEHLITPHFHRSLIRKTPSNKLPEFKPVRVKLSQSDAAAVLDCGRMALVRHLREIDPVTYSSPELVSYYQLPRGISVALLDMTPERRHPIDSYMGFVAFKNGMPVGYAGSWLLFDSGRIGLNVFPSYRGGESQYIFQHVLELHRQVYRLKRFSVDPYQLGKDNSDGIHSGAFWVWHHIGFRPIKKEQRELAADEDKKRKQSHGYRSPESVLKKLADGRMELVLNDEAVKFDATDLSRAWWNIVTTKYDGNRSRAEKDDVAKLAAILGIQDYRESDMYFVLQNWATLMLSNEKELRRNNALKMELKNLIELKVSGSEEKFISDMQRAKELRKFLESVIASYTT